MHSCDGFQRDEGFGDVVIRAQIQSQDLIGIAAFCG